MKKRKQRRRICTKENHRKLMSIGVSRCVLCGLSTKEASTVKGTLAAMKVIAENFTPPGYTRRNEEKAGLTEALDALRGMIDLVQLIKSREPDLVNNHRFIEAQRVIAKAENPNADVQQVAPAGRWTEKGTV